MHFYSYSKISGIITFQVILDIRVNFCRLIKTSQI